MTDTKQLTPDTFEAAWILQNFMCACCGADLQEKTFQSIDHGIVDGLRDVEILCPACAKQKACPYCGEVGGRPYSVTSREWQGCAEHGGYVEWVDEGCSLCMGRSSSPDPMDVAHAAMEDADLQECSF